MAIGWWKVLARFDTRLFWYVHLRLARRWLDRFMTLCTKLGGATFTVGVSASLVLWGGEVRRVGYAALTALLTSHLLVQLLKRRLERPRPYLVLADSRAVVLPLPDYSFPSGHTAASFALATVIAAHWPAWLLVAFAAAALVGVSRTYLGHHYPSDVVAGAIIGVAFAYLSLHSFRV